MKSLLKTTLVVSMIAAFAVGTANAKVSIQGKSEQSVDVKGAVSNFAMGAGKATQNLASNNGKVSISGNNKQSVDIQGAVSNFAMGVGTATQNMASNNSDD